MGSLRLSLDSNRKTVSRTTEARFEKRVADNLGVFSYHCSEKNFAGVPDRYVAGGNWIEFKVIPCSSSRAVNPKRLFRIEQRRWLSKLDAQGDRSWACVMFQASGGAYIVLEPWRVFDEREKWTWDQIRMSGVSSRGDLSGYLAKRFGQDYERYSNGVIYENAQT